MKNKEQVFYKESPPLRKYAYLIVQYDPTEHLHNTDKVLVAYLQFGRGNNRLRALNNKPAVAGRAYKMQLVPVR